MAYSFKQMTFAAMLPLIRHMVDAHLMEVAGHKTNMDACAYNNACANGSAVCYVVFDGESVVGYCIMFLVRGWHDTHDRIAFQDCIYVRPDHRNGVGRRFINWMDRQLAKLGIGQVRRSAMLKAPAAGRVYEAMHYVPDEMVYVKHLTVVNDS